MTSISRENLLKLALESEAKGDLETAIQYLEEALYNNQTSEPVPEVLLKLCDLYLQHKQEYDAYLLLKTEPDLFSDSQIFAKYGEVLRANHFLIEARELKNLRATTPDLAVTAAEADEQKKIMQNFKKDKVTQQDYSQLLKLDLANFTNFAQSLLLDPSQNFAVRISLCEDLVKLGLRDEFTVWVIGNKEKFIPRGLALLERDTVYQEIISALGSKYYHRPSQLPLVLGEANLVLGSLYPKLTKYIDEPDSFASDLAAFVETHNGREHHQLFEAIYANLPQ